MHLNTKYSGKTVSLDEALSKIKKGDRVFLGTGCGEPQSLIKAMVECTDLKDITLYQMLSGTLADYINDPSFFERFSLKLFFISEVMRKAAFEGKIEYVPAYMSQIPGLFTNYIIGLDVALIQVCPPDEFGYCSLGISVDVTKPALENAEIVIAQVNPILPRTFGDTFVHVDEIDFLVWREEPLINYHPEIRDENVARRIGIYISQLIPDGATLQIGFGSLPYSILK